ncbi:EAL domain-containing protein [Actinomycetes bacterium NPDC127524]
MRQPYGTGKKRLAEWMKIFSSHSKIRFYPPQFILRNPIVSGVRNALESGFEVAVIVFTIKNLQQLTESIGYERYHTYRGCLNKTFQEVIMDLVPEEEILVLHDYNTDGITLMLRTGGEKQSLLEIDAITYTVLREAEQRIKDTLPDVDAEFNTGYMFVEKKHYSAEEAIRKAEQQAISMADRKVETEFNQLVQQMNRIIMHKNIRLMAQPIFDVATSEIRAYEVLTRGPVGTELESPLSLFSVARQTNHLYDLEMIVLEKTLHQITENQSGQQVFINFTPVTIGNENFVSDMKNMLGKYQDVHSERIVIEITERDSIDDLAYFAKNIKLLRSLGFRVAVDDTGAGYASLHTISEVIPDIIKIDRSVIQDIDSSTIKESILKGLLLIAKEAGSLVVAEGIESAAEAMVLSRNKVDLAQGYFYAKPATMEKIPMSS